MKLRRMKVTDSKRLSLNQIRTIEITPTKSIQIILGSNGAGKSSFMEMMSPLPASAKQFNKGGSLVQEFIHRNKLYELTSNFESNKPRYSFIIDGEEQNKAGIITTQLALVEQEFGITPDIQNLIFGKEQFTKMSPERRKDWFTALSHVNYDYVLGYYGRAKERLKTASGALKHAKKRLAAESANLISEAEEEKLRSDVKQITDELNLLISQQNNTDKKFNDVNNNYERTEAILKDLTLRLSRIRLFIHDGNHLCRDEWGVLGPRQFSSVEDVQNRLNTTNNTVVYNEGILANLSKDHEKYTSTLELLKKNSFECLKSVEDEMNGLVNKNAELFLKLPTYIPVQHAALIQQSYSSVKDTLVYVFSTVDENPRGDDGIFRYGKAALERHEQKLYALKTEYEKFTKHRTSLNMQLAHMQSHKDLNGITCPKCTHSWVLNYSPENHAKLEKELADTDDYCSKVLTAITDTEQLITNQMTYRDLFTQYTQCKNNWSVLNCLWETITADSSYITHPKSVLSTLTKFEEALDVAIQIQANEIEIESFRKILAENENSVKGTTDGIQTRLNELDEEIAAVMTKIQSGKRLAREYQMYINQLNEAFRLQAELKKHSENLSCLNEQRVEALRQEFIQSCTRQLQHQLAIKQESLSVINQQLFLINDLNKQITELELEEKALKVIIEELSPNNGLISESLLGFIRIMINQVNSLIKRVWSYRLEVLDPTDKEDGNGDIDYKFPLLVNDKNNIRKDVAEGSTGMLEIIDLAFRVVAMMHLGLAGTPLFLDEFAKTLDTQHQVTAMQAIRLLMETHQFQQMFMVSHYYQNFGSFANAEICVLDPRNIALPPVYNQHVVIEKG